MKDNGFANQNQIIIHMNDFIPFFHNFFFTEQRLNLYSIQMESLTKKS